MDFLTKLYLSFSDTNVALSGWFPAVIIFILGIFINTKLKDANSKADKLTKEIKNIGDLIKLESEEISVRFKKSLSLLNEGRKNSIKISALGELLGLSSPSELEDIFYGKKKASYKIMKDFCNITGISYGWLSEGRGNPFEVINEGAIRPAEFFRSFEAKNEDRKTLLYLIVSNCPQGNVFLISKKEKEIKYSLHYVNWISNNPYLGGDNPEEYNAFDYYSESDAKLMAELADTLKFYQGKISMSSIILPEDEFEKLSSGNVYADVYLKAEDKKGQYWYLDYSDFTDGNIDSYKNLYGEKFILTHNYIKQYLGNLK